MRIYEWLKKQKLIVRILIILLVAVVSLATGSATSFYVLSLRHYHQISGYVEDASVETVELDESATDSIGLSEIESEKIRQEIKEETESIEKVEDTKVTNVLLVGVDRRDTSWNGNSDTMILISVNPSNKKIHMISFMRDLYAAIEGHGVKKLNAAYAFGAGPLLVKTIEDNYKIHIDNYASVDFSAMIDIVEILGGLEIEMTDEEAESANAQIMEMCETRNVDPEEHFFKSGGNIKCDGYQAVAYARLRAVGNADYERTERQRYVMELLINKIRNSSIMKLNELANSILPLVTHNIDEETMYSYINRLLEYRSYEIVEDRIPYDGLFTSSGELLIPVMPDTINKLQNELYGENKETNG